MNLPRSTRYDAVVIGAGLIGLACAWRAGQRGMSVLVIDRATAPGGMAIDQVVRETARLTIEKRIAQHPAILVALAAAAVST